MASLDGVTVHRHDDVSVALLLRLIVPDRLTCLDCGQAENEHSPAEFCDLCGLATSAARA